MNIAGFCMRRPWFYRDQVDYALSSLPIHIEPRYIGTVPRTLRSPLNVILSCDRLLRENPPDAAQLILSCATIVRNARAQLQLIAELLTSRTGKLAAIRLFTSGPRAIAAYEGSGQAAWQS